MMMIQANSHWREGWRNRLRVMTVTAETSAQKGWDMATQGQPGRVTAATRDPDRWCAWPSSRRKAALFLASFAPYSRFTFLNEAISINQLIEAAVNNYKVDGWNNSDLSSHRSVSQSLNSRCSWGRTARRGFWDGSSSPLPASGSPAVP